MSKPHKFQFFRRALRQLRDARAIADPAIANAHRRLAALYVERGARMDGSRPAFAYAEGPGPRRPRKREARS